MDSRYAGLRSGPDLPLVHVTPRRFSLKQFLCVWAGPGLLMSIAYVVSQSPPEHRLCASWRPPCPDWMLTAWPAMQRVPCWEQHARLGVGVTCKGLRGLRYFVKGKERGEGGGE